jgi:hypothetical protein
MRSFVAQRRKRIYLRRLTRGHATSSKSDAMVTMVTGSAHSTP